MNGKKWLSLYVIIFLISQSIVQPVEKKVGPAKGQQILKPAPAKKPPAAVIAKKGGKPKQKMHVHLQTKTAKPVKVKVKQVQPRKGYSRSETKNDIDFLERLTSNRYGKLGWRRKGAKGRKSKHKNLHHKKGTKLKGYAHFDKDDFGFSGANQMRLNVQLLPQKSRSKTTTNVRKDYKRKVKIGLQSKAGKTDADKSHKIVGILCKHCKSLRKRPKKPKRKKTKKRKSRHGCLRPKRVFVPSQGWRTYTIYQNLRIKRAKPHNAGGGRSYFDFPELTHADRGHNKDSALEVEIGKRQKVTAIIFQPVTASINRGPVTAMMRAFTLKCLGKNDEWSYVYEEGTKRMPEVFKINSAKNKDATVVNFPKPLETSSIRIFPQDWQMRPWISISLNVCNL